MSLKSIFLGIAVTAVLLAVLVLTRLMVLVTPEAEYEIRAIETVTLAEPPPVQEQIQEDGAPPPPPPALANLSTIPDLDVPAVPLATMVVDPRLAVDPFFTDQAPAAMPSQPRPKVSKVGKPSTPTRTKPRVNSRPQQKSEYSLSELDQKPRLLRNPSVSFPRSIKNAKSGRVTVRVAILPSGKTQFVAVVSSTHKQLIPAARRIANGSRFTPPTRQGKPVKVVMSWPITIKK